MEVCCRLVADALNGVFAIVSDLRRQKGFAVAGRGIAMEDRAENPKISYTVTLVDRLSCLPQ